MPVASPPGGANQECQQAVTNVPWGPEAAWLRAIHPNLREGLLRCRPGAQRSGGGRSLNRPTDTEVKVTELVDLCPRSNPGLPVSGAYALHHTPCWSQKGGGGGVEMPSTPRSIPHLGDSRRAAPSRCGSDPRSSPWRRGCRWICPALPPPAPPSSSSLPVLQPQWPPPSDRRAPAPGPLHLLLPLPGTLCPAMFASPAFSLRSGFFSNTTSSGGGLL